jgi:hypothetical protein
MQRLGKAQKAIIVALAAKPMTVVELAAQIYGVEPSAVTRAQNVTIRKAIARLIDGHFVKESAVFTRDGANCWILDQAQIREALPLRLVK